ncbi:MAG: ROK family protein [Oscillospiraceae bacterium]|jgi:fructokinase|nr:ROK family protein [Oscillospiraceae bacterium]
MDLPLLGALEGGGTKMVCAVGTADGTVLDRASFETGLPETTLPRLIHYFQDKGIQALGIGSFGPVDLRAESKTYGYITSTPKPGWAYIPFMPILRDALEIPVAFDNDVNAAALGEWKLGAGCGLNSLVYITVGTGVGAGIVAEGRLVHGLVHPELGHMLLRPEPGEINPRGVCPYHDGCLEGLASGPSIQKRWNMPARELPPDHRAWELETGYLAQCCANVIVAYSPERIVLGGGVMQQEFLYSRIRARTLELLGGYVRSDIIERTPETYIVPPALGNNSAVVGALLLANQIIHPDRG